jgi:O-antigen ligase
MAGVAMCLLMGIVVSLSRMGLVSTLFAMAVVALALLGAQNSDARVSANAKSRAWFYRWRWIIPLALPLLVFLLIPTNELKQRFSEASTEDVNADVRVAIWRDTVHSLQAHPWIGSGLGGYERALYQYKTAKPTKTLDFAHNDYLQIAVELGIPGLALALLLGVWILWRSLAVALWHRDVRNWELSVGLLGALVAIGMHSMTDFNLYIPANATAFAWLGGLSVSQGLRLR